MENEMADLCRDSLLHFYYINLFRTTAILLDKNYSFNRIDSSIGANINPRSCSFWNSDLLRTIVPERPPGVAGDATNDSQMLTHCLAKLQREWDSSH